MLHRPLPLQFQFLDRWSMLLKSFFNSSHFNPHASLLSSTFMLMASESSLYLSMVTILIQQWTANQKQLRSIKLTTSVPFNNHVFIAYDVVHQILTLVIIVGCAHFFLTLNVHLSSFHFHNTAPLRLIF